MMNEDKDIDIKPYLELLIERKKTIFHVINYPYVNIDTIEDLKNTKKLAKKFNFNG